MTRGHHRGHSRKLKGSNTRKNNSRLKFIKGKIHGKRTDIAPMVAGVWDRRKTLKQNYDRLGLQGDVNRVISANSVTKQRGGITNEKQGIKVVDWVDLDAIPKPEELASRRPKFHMSEEEQIYVSLRIEIRS